jgi:hypothetical protein
MQPITLQCDLFCRLRILWRGSSGHRSSEIPAPARPLSLLAAASHRFRKAQLGAASGQGARLAKSPYRVEVVFHSSKERVPSRASGVHAGPRDMHVKKGIQGATCDCEDAIGIPLGSRRENNGQQDARPGRDRHW